MASCSSILNKLLRDKRITQKEYDKLMRNLRKDEKEQKMTKEEAISIMKKWRNIGSYGMTLERLGYIEGWFHDYDAEAFEMAIKALKLEKATKSPCALCKWHAEENYANCVYCNAKPITEGEKNG